MVLKISWYVYQLTCQRYMNSCKRYSGKKTSLKTSLLQRFVFLMNVYIFFFIGWQSYDLVKPRFN